MDKKNTMLLTVIAVATLLVAVVGATFAYFSVTATNNATNTTVTGSAESMGAITLTTNTSALKLNLDATQMAQAKNGTSYYATVDGTASTTANSFDLATASVADGDTKYDCEYSYKVTASITTAVTDGSDDDITVDFAGDSITSAKKSYTLKEILAAGDTGVEIAGKFTQLTAGTDQKITVSSKLTNVNEEQNGLAGNGYTITLAPSSTFTCTAVN